MMPRATILTRPAQREYELLHGLKVSSPWKTHPVPLPMKEAAGLEDDLFIDFLLGLGVLEVGSIRVHLERSVGDSLMMKRPTILSRRARKRGERFGSFYSTT